MPPRAFDLAIVGAGICGLAHALAAARRGKRVVVVDRDRQANGASIRNFGFITVTGQQAGECWRRARRSREVWAEVADAAGIPVAAARAPDDRAGGRRRAPFSSSFSPPTWARSAASSSREISRPMERACGRKPSPARSIARTRSASSRARRSRAWLPGSPSVIDVTFRRETVVHAAAPPRLETSRGTIEAEAVVVCPGDDFLTPAR